MRSLLFVFAILFSIQIHAQTYTGSIGPISDDGLPNYYAAVVSGLSPAAVNVAHGLLTVCINITHTWDSDLDVRLIAPDSTEILLFSGIGGGDDNFTNSCFNDSAGTNIVSGTAPFTGNFIPMDILGNANNGQNGNGTWKLKIVDTYPYVDAGTVLGWSITFGNNATAPLVIDSTLLPIVSIDTYGQTITDEPKINAGMKVIYNGYGNQNHPSDPPNIYNGKIGIEIRGSYSAWFPQKPFGIETRDNAGNNLDVSLLGMPAENDWILLALYNDKVFMRSTLAFKLFELMGNYATRTRYCEVSINKSYQGIYVFMEKVKRDNHRIDIAKLDVDDNAGDSLTGGYIIKLDYHDTTNSWQSNFHPVDHPALDVFYVYNYPEFDVITAQQKNYIQSFYNSLEAVLYGPGFTDPQTGYRAWLDVSSFIDYFIVNEVSRNNDGFKKSWFMYKDKDSKNGLLKFGPPWDFDWAWKNINECSIFAATDGSGWAYKTNDCSPDNNSMGWAVRLMQDTSFTHQLNCRYFNLRQTILDTNYLFNYIDSVHTLVEAAQARHYRKWPILGINVGTPEVDYQPLTYDGEVQKFKNWIKLRLEWLDANMPGHCPDVGVSDERKEIVVRIFPNPATEILFIESETQLRKIEIYNSTGALVRSVIPARFSVSIALNDLADGLYLVKCTNINNQMMIRKILKN